MCHTCVRLPVCLSACLSVCRVSSIHLSPAFASSWLLTCPLESIQLDKDHSSCGSDSGSGFGSEPEHELELSTANWQSQCISRELARKAE